MRKFLFRGKDYIGDWHYGSLVYKACENKSMTNYYANSGMCNHIIKTGDYYIIDEYGEGFWVEPSTIGQFTNFTDKNNRDIFEGDVVRVRYYDGEYKEEVVEDRVVVYSIQHAGFIPMIWNIEEDFEMREIEIIGNTQDKISIK